MIVMIISIFEIINMSKTCINCKIEYPISYFQEGKKIIYNYNKCKKCRYVKVQAKRDENVIYEVAHHMYNRFKPNPEGTTVQTFIYIVNKLPKICYISGIDLTVKNKCFNTLSPERIDETKKTYLEAGNVKLICRLFQSGSHPVDVETENTVIKETMKKQILENPQDITRISKKKKGHYDNGTLYKKIIRFNIDFNNDEEVNEEIQFLPNNMSYVKTNETFIVTKEGNQKYFGKKLGTLQERFKKAMEYYKKIYYSDYQFNDEYVEFGVGHDGNYRKILICPKTNYMTINPIYFKNHQLYTNFPECSSGKPQWTPEKFKQVKELSTREDSQERSDYINKIIEDSVNTVEEYRSNDEVRPNLETPLICYINERARNYSKLGIRKSGNYKECFLAIYDKICENRLRCDYTNISMSLKQCYDWSLSVERIDNRKPYSRENILLACAEFNTREHWKPEHFIKFWDIDNLDFETKMKFGIC